MSGIEILTYEEKDKDRTIEFIVGILEGEFGFSRERPDLANIPNFYQAPNGNFWLAVENDVVVGTIALKDYEEGRGYLKRMYVKRELRGTGLADKLLSELVEHAKKNGFETIYLGTDVSMRRAQGFYSKKGFEKMDRLPDGLPDFGDTIFFKLDI